jgi:hypothetical protein
VRSERIGESWIESAGGLWKYKRRIHVSPEYFLILYCPIISGVESAGSLGIHFTIGTSCERAAPLAQKNAAARHRALKNLINLHNEHRVHYHGKVTQEIFLRKPNGKSHRHAARYQLDDV